MVEKKHPLNQTVGELGEQGLLKIIQKFCPTNIIGDDGAILTPAPHQLLVTTTDLLVEKVHFNHLTINAKTLGWRSVAVNLSDLAAMGAMPLGLTIGLSLPPHLEVKFVEELYQGLQECAKKYNCPIVGGDLVKSELITIAITALGQVFPNQIISRFTARKDDLIMVTGNHGSSRGGLELLLNQFPNHSLNPTEVAELIKAHQLPQPRLDVIPLLWENHEHMVISGMDSSDGLADAVLQICRASQVGAEIYAEAIPIAPSLKKLVGAEKALEYALYGGEDFELVLCLPPKNAEILVKKLAGNGTIIGKITEDRTVKLVDNTGFHHPQLLTLEKGFQHFTKG